MTSPKEIVQLLLSYEADPHIQDREGNTAIHRPAIKNDITIIRLLKAYKAQVNIHNHHGYTPSDLARSAHSWQAYHALYQ